MDTRPKTILIVEDELAPLLRSMLKMADAGYRVVTAKTGTGGVRKAKTEKPDLILMDIWLPVMDGVEATREIRKFNTEVPILVITAFPNRTREALNAGGDFVMEKPLCVTGLLDKVKSMIEKGRV